MKVRAKVRIYNDVMLSRRKELGYTQMVLAKLAGVNIDFIGKAERLEKFSNTMFKTIERNLHRIATCLEVPFYEIFPIEYLALIQKDKLPKSTRWLWVRELNLAQLPPQHSTLMLPSAEELYEKIEHEEKIKSDIDGVLSRLNDQETYVIKRRFGLDGEKGLLLEEVAIEMGISRERVRQIEVVAIRKIRGDLTSVKTLRDHFRGRSRI